MIVRRLLLREVACTSGVLADHFALASIGRVTPYPPLLSMQQVGERLAVVHVGCARHHRVNQLAATVHADVRFHAEVPLISLLCLMHLGVALLVLVLRRGRRIDDAGIDDRARAQLHSLALQMRVDLGKDRFAQAMLLQQMPELAHRGFIRSRFPPKIDAHKVAHRDRVIQRLTAGSDKLNHCCRK